MNSPSERTKKIIFASIAVVLLLLLGVIGVYEFSEKGAEGSKKGLETGSSGTVNSVSPQPLNNQAGDDPPKNPTNNPPTGPTKGSSPPPPSPSDIKKDADEPVKPKLPPEGQKNNETQPSKNEKSTESKPSTSGHNETPQNYQPEEPNKNADPVVAEKPKDLVYLMLKGFEGRTNLYSMYSDGSEIKLVSSTFFDLKPDTIRYRQADKKAIVCDDNVVYEVKFPSLEYKKIVDFGEDAEYQFINSDGSGAVYCMKGNACFLVDLANNRKIFIEAPIFPIWGNRSIILESIESNGEDKNDTQKFGLSLFNGLDIETQTELVTLEDFRFDLLQSNALKTLAFIRPELGYSFDLYSIAKNAFMGRNLKATKLTLSPDDRYVAFLWIEKNGEDVINIFDMEVGNIVKSIPSPETVHNWNFVSWSPDSKHLYLLQEQGRNDNLFVLSIETLELQELVDDSKPDLVPEYDSSIDYSSIDLIYNGEKGQIIRMNSDGSDPKLLREYQAFDLKDLKYNFKLKRACFVNDGCIMNLETMKIEKIVTNIDGSTIIIFNNDCTAVVSFSSHKWMPTVTVKNLTNLKTIEERQIQISGLIRESVVVHSDFISFARYTEERSVSFERFNWNSMKLIQLYERKNESNLPAKKASDLEFELELEDYYDVENSNESDKESENEVDVGVEARENECKYPLAYSDRIRRCSFSNDGKLIAFLTLGADLIIYNIELEKELKLSNSRNDNIIFSPDSAYIAIENSFGDEISFFDTTWFYLISSVNLRALHLNHLLEAQQQERSVHLIGLKMEKWSGDGKYLYCSFGRSAYAISVDIFEPTKVIYNNLIKKNELDNNGDEDNKNQELLSEENFEDHIVFFNQYFGQEDKPFKIALMSTRSDGSDVKKVFDENSHNYNFEQFRYSSTKMIGIFKTYLCVYVINLRTFEIKTIEENVHKLAFNSTLTGIVVQKSDGSTKFRNLTDNNIVNLKIRYRVEFMELTDDNSLIFASGPEIIKWKFDSLSDPNTIAEGKGNITNLFCSNDGNIIAYSDAYRDYLRIMKEGLEIFNLSHVREFSFSPDSSKFACIIEQELFVQDVDEKDPVKINIPKGLRIAFIDSWSIDGKYLYLVPCSDGSINYAIFVVVSLETNSVVNVQRL